MKTAVKVFSYLQMIVGGLVVLSSFTEGFSAFLGGGLFFTAGLLSYLYVKKSVEINSKVEKIKQV